MVLVVFGAVRSGYGQLRGTVAGFPRRGAISGCISVAVAQSNAISFARERPVAAARGSAISDQGGGGKEVMKGGYSLRFGVL